MELRIAAPNRIDLGGGTTDIYPLYLFMDGGCTVNIAITVLSMVTFRVHGGVGVRITSEDLEKTIEAPDPDNLPLDGPLGLIARAVKAIPPDAGLEIITCNQAPAGSGLGASSALIAAVIRGLQHLRNEKHEPTKLCALAMNIETSHIGVPAGNQDHIASVFGGISMIDFGHNSFCRSSLPRNSKMLKLLEQSLVLSYTGLSRFSGMNNWEITKDFIDGKNNVREKLIQIRNIAKRMTHNILAGDWHGVGRLIDEEWQIRRTLAEGVSTQRIDGIMLSAMEAGALANKICGAGGGGCMITFVDPVKRSQVEEAIVTSGGKLIPFSIARQGAIIDCDK